MRLLIFSIQHPSDPQVNGFGIYRTGVNGVDAFLIKREAIPDNPPAAICHPWEACDVDNEKLILNWTVPSIFNFSDTTKAGSAT